MHETEVAVIGAGPVGLYLGARLAMLGIRVELFDARDGPIQEAESRAIGIHPPSLEGLATLGLVGSFLREGVKVRRGHAFSSRGHLGSVDFAGRPGPYPFVLTLAQSRTETLLSEYLHQHPEAMLHRGVRVTQVVGETHTGRIATDDGRRVRAAFVVGCEGKHSLVREIMGATFAGALQSESYAMVDLHDETCFGSDAALFLADEGLVESFPLPGRRRRWVVERTGREQTSAEEVAHLIRRRSGQPADASTVTMLSSFGVEQWLAGRFASGRLLLCGDAAHVVSPFGGQGMNLGWLDANRLAILLHRVLRGGEAELPQLFARYEHEGRRAAGRALRRAALNRRLGHRCAHPRLRNGLTRLLLAAVPNPVLARVFTMADLY